jgi:hypothetical protein
MSEKPRPACIDTYLKWDSIEKDAKNQKENVRAEVLKVLKVSRFKDIELRISKAKTSIDALKATEWAKLNLKPEEYKSLFVESFDPNAFISLMKLKKLRPADLPPGTVKRGSPGQSIIPKVAK